MERGVSTLLYMLYSLPSFVAGLLLLILFYKNLEGTVFQLKPGMISENYDQLSDAGKVLDIAKHMICGYDFVSGLTKASEDEALRMRHVTRPVSVAMNTAKCRACTAPNIRGHRGTNVLLPESMRNAEPSLSTA